MMNDSCICDELRKTEEEEKLTEDAKKCKCGPDIKEICSCPLSSVEKLELAEKMATKLQVAQDEIDELKKELYQLQFTELTKHNKSAAIYKEIMKGSALDSSFGRPGTAHSTLKDQSRTLYKPNSSVKTFAKWQNSNCCVFISTTFYSEPNPDIPASFEFQTTPITKPTISKRNLSEIATPSPEDTPDITNSSEPKSYFTTPVPKVPKKKLKSKDKPSLEFRELPQKITNFIDNHNPKFPLDSQQFTDLLENTHGSYDALSIAKDYTLHIPSLIEIINEIHTQAEDRNMKTKCKNMPVLTSSLLDKDTSHSACFRRKQQNQPCSMNKLKYYTSSSYQPSKEAVSPCSSSVELLTVADDVTYAQEIFHGDLREGNSHKRKADKGQWKKIINKLLRMQGKKHLGYTNPKHKKMKQNKIRPERPLGVRCESNFCKRSKKRLCEQISDEDRKNFFTIFAPT
ncbi:unnamed protein product [Diabrotica balteata]|uniref:Uncharacterized protein n=1 Tax=Diabrotica balteata TaxID=107213 RepID=A0A9N9T0L2_DIABA|nr:unnamed protein product [Diabrotica balteata]